MKSEYSHRHCVSFRLIVRANAIKYSYIRSGQMKSYLV